MSRTDDLERHQKQTQFPITTKPVITMTDGLGERGRKRYTGIILPRNTSNVQGCHSDSKLQKAFNGLHVD